MNNVAKRKCTSFLVLSCRASCPAQVLQVRKDCQTKQSCVSEQRMTSQDTSHALTPPEVMSILGSEMSSALMELLRTTYR